MWSYLEASFRAHPYLGAGVVVVAFAIWGYIEHRLYPDAPAIASLTWFWALMIVVAGLAVAPDLGNLGPVAAVAAFVTGGLLIGSYY